METKPSDDADLLREFAASQNQHAFRTLVERYQHMVFGTARRRLGEDQAASDVAQNVFAALAKKAPWLSARTNVGGWLYKSTLMEAARRQRDDLRRYKRERRYAEEMNIRGTNDDDGDEPQLKELTPVLDEAMNRLSESDREALLLRFFRGLSLRDTGTALGTTEEAARKRVSRALEKLNAMFKRKGVVMPTALLAAAALPKMASHAAAPAGFAAKVTASAAAAPAPGLVASAFLKTLAMTKMQVAAACLVATAAPITWQAAKIHALRSEKASLEASVVTLSAPHRGPRTVPVQPMSAAGETRPAAAPDKPQEKKGNGWEKFAELRKLERNYQKQARLEALSQRLHLDDAQRAIAAAAFDKASAARRALWDAGTPPDRAAGDAIRSVQDEEIAAVLSDDKLEAYREFMAEEEQNRQEIFANRLLGEMQDFLHLSAEQKDQLWTVFSEQAAQAEGDPSPWAWSQTMDDGRDAQLSAILEPSQFQFWEARVKALKATMRPDRPAFPAPPGAAAAQK